MKLQANNTVLACGGLAASLVAAALVTLNAGAAPHAAPVAKKHQLDPASPDVVQAIRVAKGLSMAFRAVSEQLLPSVVTVETTPKIVDAGSSRRASPPGFNGQNPFEDTPFEEYFRDRTLKSPRRPSTPGAGLGSGVIIDARGLVMTNNHVVRGGEVTVRLQDGRKFTAVDVWTDPKTDIALVKIDADGLVAARLGDSDQVAVGDWVLALGQPFGLKSSVTAGIISAMHRGIGITDRENFLQTDAAINPGNSGGPLVNLDGEVVGINTAISSRSGGSDGVGFAVPINLAKWVSQQLADGGVVHRAYLGVGIQPVTAELAEQFHVSPGEGVVVTQVMPGTPAAKAGIRAGDVIRTFDGKVVHSTNDLQLAVERAAIGGRFPMEVVRDGKRIALHFTPQKQPQEFGIARPRADDPVGPETMSIEDWGLAVRQLDSSVADQLGVDSSSGLVVTRIKSGSAADAAGLRSGDIIAGVNQQPIRALDDLREALRGADSDRGVLLLIRSAGGSRFVVLKT